MAAANGLICVLVHSIYTPAKSEQDEKLLYRKDIDVKQTGDHFKAS